jgi:hypothetical protein
MIRELEPEARVRLRNWICKAFDSCGQPYPVETLDDIMEVYRVADFERANIREFQELGRYKDRGLPPNSGGIYAIATDRDWLYVGRTNSLAKRRCNHASTLRHGTHQNSLLQRWWDSNEEAMWFIILERWPDPVQVRKGVEHPNEFLWKRRLHPLCDRLGRKADISLLIQPVNGAPSWTWPGGPPTLPRSTSKSWGLPS